MSETPSRIALDTSAVIAWLTNETGADEVERVVTTASTAVVLPGPVLTETIYVMRRSGNASSPAEIAGLCAAYGMVVEHPHDTDVVRAGALVGSVVEGRPVSLGDALILAVVERLGCPVVTGDRAWADLARQSYTSAAVVVLR